MGHVLQKEVQQKYSNPRVITLPKFNWLAPENGWKMILPIFKGYLSFKQGLEIPWDKCEQAKVISNAGFFFHQQYMSKILGRYPWNYHICFPVMNIFQYLFQEVS